MSIEFESAEKSDQEYMWQLYVTAMRPHIAAMWGWDSAWQKNCFEEQFVQYDSYVFRCGAQRAGYAQLELADDSTFLNMVILEPNYQGRGMGPSILNSIQRMNPGKPLNIRCFQVNERARKFYLGVGFDVTHTDDKFISMRRSA